jgi:hypothetical protein
VWSGGGASLLVMLVSEIVWQPPSLKLAGEAVLQEESCLMGPCSVLGSMW